MFSIFMFLQYNDPDPLVWMIVWAVAAAASLVFVMNRISFALTLAIGIFALIGFIYLYPSNFQGFDLKDGDIGVVEKGREAFGFLLISLVMFVYASRIRYVNRS